MLFLTTDQFECFLGIILVLSTAKNVDTVKVLAEITELYLFTFMMVGQKIFSSKHLIGMKKAVVMETLFRSPIETFGDFVVLFQTLLL